MMDWLNELDPGLRMLLGGALSGCGSVLILRILGFWGRPAPCKTQASQLPPMSKGHCIKCGSTSTVGTTFCPGCRKISGEHVHRWCEWGCGARWYEQCYVEKVDKR